MPSQPDAASIAIATGIEWLVDASGCSPEALQSVEVFATLFDRIVADLGLHPVHPPVWHRFSGGGSGITGLVLLSESHLACHTFPERGFAAVNLYCCRERPDWPWPTELARALGASHVAVRRVARGSRIDAWS